MYVVMKMRDKGGIAKKPVWKSGRLNGWFTSGVFIYDGIVVDKYPIALVKEERGQHVGN